MKIFFREKDFREAMYEHDEKIRRMEMIERALCENAELKERIIYEADAVEALAMFPSADAEVSDYAKWLEDIIVKAETLEWLCEDTNDKEWCEKNCHYSSIQAECLRHLYKVSKGGDDE